MAFLETLKTMVNPIAGIADMAKDIIGLVRGKLPPEEQAKVDAAMAQLELQAAREEREHELALVRAYNEEVKDLRDQIRVELQSEDKFVRRARPAWLWGLLLVYLANYGVPGLLNGVRQLWPGTPVLVPVDIPPEVHALTTGIVLGISYLRGIDKAGAKPPLSK